MMNTLVLGKVDADNRGRKINEVDIEWELTPDGRFSASGNVWNSPHTDIVSGGQNLEEIAKMFPKDERVKRIVEVWRTWHLNDMKAGTPEQEKAIKKWISGGNRYEYDKAVEYLKGEGLYEVDLEGTPYRYGTKWLKEELPSDVRDEIKSWNSFPQGSPKKVSTRKKTLSSKRSSSTPTSIRGMR